MRLFFKLCPNTDLVPFDYQHFLIGAFHKWLGENELHDKLSLYSLSWMDRAQKMKDGLKFPNGASWFISAYDKDIIKSVMLGVLKDPEICCGMRVIEMQIKETPEFGSYYRFFTSSPVLVRKFDGMSLQHLFYTDKVTDEILTDILKKKLYRAGINQDNVKVTFDRGYDKARTKMVTIKGIHNKANCCPVIIEGTPEAVSFAWDVGVGHSTGSCFGSLY